METKFTFYLSSKPLGRGSDRACWTRSLLVVPAGCSFGQHRAQGRHSTPGSYRISLCLCTVPCTQTRWQSADLGCLYCTQRSRQATSPASSHGHWAALEAHALLPKARLGSSGKIPFVRLDVENMPNHLPKTSSWRLC